MTNIYQLMRMGNNYINEIVDLYYFADKIIM